MGELPIVTVNDYHKMVETFQKDGDSYANRLTTLDEFHELVRGISSYGKWLSSTISLLKAVFLASLTRGAICGANNDVLPCTFFAILASARTLCSSGYV